MSSRLPYFETLLGPAIDDPEAFRALVEASQPAVEGVPVLEFEEVSVEEGENGTTS